MVEEMIQQQYNKKYNVSEQSFTIFYNPLIFDATTDLSREENLPIQVLINNLLKNVWKPGYDSTVAVRIFTFESNDNCSCPQRMISNKSSSAKFIKSRGNNIAFTIFSRVSSLLSKIVSGNPLIFGLI